MPDAQLVTVTGPCGIGRTRLAWEVARSGGAALLTVEPDWVPTQVPGALARALGRPKPQEADPGQTLTRLLEDREAQRRTAHRRPGVAGALMQRDPDMKVLITFCEWVR